MGILKQVTNRLKRHSRVLMHGDLLVRSLENRVSTQMWEMLEASFQVAKSRESP